MESEYSFGNDDNKQMPKTPLTHLRRTESVGRLNLKYASEPQTRNMIHNTRVYSPAFTSVISESVKNLKDSKLGNGKQCLKHDMPRNVYCRTDKDFFCNVCVVYDGHLEHSCIPVTQLLKEQQEYKDKVRSIEAEINILKSSQADNETQLKHSIAVELEKFTESIFKTSQELIRKIERNRDDILEQLKSELDSLSTKQKETANEFRVVESLIQTKIDSCLTHNDTPTQFAESTDWKEDLSVLEVILCEYREIKTLPLKLSNDCLNRFNIVMKQLPLDFVNIVKPDIEEFAADMHRQIKQQNNRFADYIRQNTKRRLTPFILPLDESKAVLEEKVSRKLLGEYKDDEQEEDLLKPPSFTSSHQGSLQRLFKSQSRPQLTNLKKAKNILDPGRSDLRRMFKHSFVGSERIQSPMGFGLERPVVNEINKVSNFTGQSTKPVGLRRQRSFLKKSLIKPQSILKKSNTKKSVSPNKRVSEFLTSEAKKLIKAQKNSKPPSRLTNLIKKLKRKKDDKTLDLEDFDLSDTDIVFLSKERQLFDNKTHLRLSNNSITDTGLSILLDFLTRNETIRISHILLDKNKLTKKCFSMIFRFIHGKPKRSIKEIYLVSKGLFATKDEKDAIYRYHREYGCMILI